MKRIFIVITALLMLMFATVLAQEKPNILFIAVDDLNDFPSYMNRYEGAITPNLDKLANQGMAFNRAFSQYTVCAPSRASVMSGLYPHRLSGKLNQDDVVQESTRTLGSELMHTWFRNNGYKTLAVGKILHRHLPDGTLDESGGRGLFSAGLGKLKKNWHQNGTMTDWAKEPESDEQMPDHQAAEWAVDQLSEKHDKPFFLMVGFLRPHNPWYVPEKWWDIYDREKIQLPPYKKDDLDDIPKAGLKNIKDQMPRTEWAIDTDQWRDIVHSYLASITFVDHQIGKVMSALEESEYSDNTIIVLWSDHGYHMGEKNTFQKHSLWERSTHAPLLFAGHGVPEGKSSDRVVSLLDIYPTLVEMSGLPGNSKNEGRSLVPLMEDPSAEWPYPSITGYGEDCYAIQNDRYRYIRYNDGGEELYDLQNDPNEWTNLAGKHDMAKIKAELARYIPGNDSKKEGRYLSDPVKEPSVVEVQKWRSSNWIEYQTITVDHLKEYKEKPVKICKYGGRLDTQEKATGFFYTKKVNGAWTLVDPCGHHYISMSVNSIAPNDQNPDSKDAFKKKFGNEKDWAVKTAALLKDKLHLNSLGCWSSWELFKEAGTPIPYFKRWNVMSRYAQEKNLTYKKYGHTGFENNVIPVFDPEFAVFCDKLFQNMGELRDDPYLIGHFSDNELPLKEKDIIKRHLECGDNSSSAQRAKSWLKERGKTVDDITEKDDREFCKLVLSTYYRIVSENLKKYDPNHLYVGTRVHGGVLNASVTYEASGPYVDVVSMNYYHRWSPEQDLLNERARLSGKPLLITEWYAKGVDGGLPLTAGAGFAVHTQKERGMFYENYTLGLLKNKNVLGWHWHRYIDDGPKHRKENASNKGYLDTQFNEWEGLTNSVQRINKQVYSLRDYLLTLESDNFPDKPRQAKE